MFAEGHGDGHYCSMRVFAGIGVPEQVKDHLGSALEMVRSPSRSRNPWIPQVNWHITLVFYGNQPDGMVGELVSNLEAAARTFSPFEVNLAHAGVFHHDVCWVGVNDPTNSLGPLAEEVRGQYAVDNQHTKNRFHMTISRSGRRAELADTMAAMSIYQGTTWVVDSITLWESHLGEGPGGHPLYSSLKEVPLG